MDRPFITGTLLASWAAAVGVVAAMCLLAVLMGRKHGQIKRSWLSSAAITLIATPCMVLIAAVWAVFCSYVPGQISEVAALLLLSVGTPVLPTFFVWRWLKAFFQIRPPALIGHVTTGVLAGVAIFVLGILPISGRSLEIARGFSDGGSLRSIRAGLLMYRQDKGHFPSDLRALVDSGYVVANNLLCVGSDSQGTASRPYAGPVDFTYVPLPDRAPDDLIWVWQDPRFRGGEGGNVLDRSGEVHWADRATIDRELARTRAWLAEHAAASQPSTAAMSRIPQS